MSKTKPKSYKKPNIPYKNILASGSRTVRQPKCQKIVRGYFSLHDWEGVVHVTSNADFLVCIWARNVETFDDGVQISTPASRFQGRGSTGHPTDALFMDVPAQKGMDLGCIGGSARETIDISSANARITIFVTVVTEHSANVNMTWERGTVP